MVSWVDPEVSFLLSSSTELDRSFHRLIEKDKKENLGVQGNLVLAPRYVHKLLHSIRNWNYRDAKSLSNFAQYIFRFEFPSSKKPHSSPKANKKRCEQTVYFIQILIVALFTLK